MGLLGTQYRYPVVDVFKTLQGEGHFVGYPAVFIRLAGCSVTKCSIRRECDEAPWKAKEKVGAAELARRAWEILPGGIAVITGGEPTDHDLVPLVDCLHSYGLRVHLETSGVRPIEGYAVEWLTVSPKTLDYAQRQGHVLKVVVRPGMTFDDVLALDRDTTFFHRYLQPLTVLDLVPLEIDPTGRGAVPQSNLVEVAQMVLANSVAGRWALSDQAHKRWGLP